MKICAIDIGSNSVRLATFADGKTLYKSLCTTRLGEGLAASGRIDAAACERTARAVSKFASRAEKEGAQRVYAFATAAVRSASNRSEFLDRVRELCGLEVDVVSGELEAELGITGALGKGEDGGIIDVGGASTEATFRRGGTTVYSKSVDIGTVRLFDTAGRDFAAVCERIRAVLPEYGSFDASDLKVYNIGGTGTQIAAVKHGLKIYDPNIIHGTYLTRDEIYDMGKRFLAMTVEEVKAVSGMEERRADVIGGGCLLLAMVMERFGLKGITVSENDNLEGYVMLKEGSL